MKGPFNFLSKKIELKIPVWAILIIPLFLYAAWEYYWFTKVGLRIVKWHTHLAVYVYLWVAGAFVFRLLFGTNSSLKAQNGFLVFSSVLFALVLLEAYLEISGRYKTYLEQVSGFYDSPYTPQDPGWYHAWTPGKPHYITKPEYSFWRPTNSLGFGDREWSTIKKAGEKRILALGDSFTEGDGAAYDSSFVALLNKKLLAHGDTFYVMNGGVCGSDPFNNYIFLKNRLLAYQPDIIIQGFSTDDLKTDIALRGGMERFKSDGTQQFSSAPVWEPLYALSYVSRIFFSFAGYNELLRKGELSSTETANLNNKVSELFEKYSKLCKEKNIMFVVVLRPDKPEIANNKYDYDLRPVLSRVKANNSIHVIDLLSSYKSYLAKGDTDVNHYFWKYDGHHNAKGYEMMAQTIYDNVMPLLENQRVPLR